MNYANNTYNNSNTEYSTASSLKVNKNIIQYGSNYIVSENISSMSVSQLVRKIVSPFKSIIGTIILFISFFFLVYGIVRYQDAYTYTWNSRYRNSNSSAYIGCIVLGMIIAIVAIIIIIQSINKRVLFYLVISLNSGKNVCFYCHSIDFMNDALIKITKVITEKSTETYVVNFQECNIVDGPGDIYNIQGNNNTVVSK